MLFTKLSLFTIFIAVSSSIATAGGFTIDTPSSWNNGGSNFISWNTSSGAPASFSMVLTGDGTQFSLAIDIDVPPVETGGEISVQSTTVSSGTYELEFVDIQDINEIFAQSAPFTID